MSRRTTPNGCAVLCSEANARSRHWLVKLAMAAVVLIGAEPAAAHGLGERYDLPLPLGLYLAGAAATVALSFGMLALFASADRLVAANGRPGYGWTVPSWSGGEWLALGVRGLSVALFALLIAAGLFGSPDPFKNPLPVLVWVLGWVGLAYVNALLGNVWAVVNPWDNAFRAWEWLAHRRGARPSPASWLAYPAWLQAWPAVALFFIFAWLELVWPGRDHPAALATVILAYSALTWAGMALFGRQAWLERGEFLTVAFGLLARFAILGRHEPGAPLNLRPPAVGLLVDEPVSASLAAFALLMLSTVTFDGLLETPLWAAISELAAGWPALQAAGDLVGVRPYLLLATAALIVFPLAFAAVYVLTARVMAGLVAETEVTTSQVIRLFVLTLIPIAIGYHLSHYLAYLLVAGQFIIPIVSDPFALGWNLFGTKLYLIDFSVIDARFVWLSSLGLIVGGHVIAVWLAHEQAQRLLSSRRAVLRSQTPMLVLMIGYTALSLWILAQPIVEP